MKLDDFAFIFRGKIVGALTNQDAHHLLPVDRHVTQRRDHALLLLHGFASSPAVYRGLVPLITGYDRIVCPVLPGHADSLEAFGKSTAQDWQNSAITHCQRLIDDYANVTVVGFSLGGLLALELSKRFSLYHLYLLAPSLKCHFPVGITLYCARLLQKIGWQSLPNYSGNLYCDAYQELSYRRVPLTTIIEILFLIQQHSFTRPTCPTDIFFGQFDKVIDSKGIAKHYATQSSVTIHWLNHSAHILPLDGDLTNIAQWLQRK